ncbi:MAG: hypothetical protein ABL933_17910 [Methyloglobulus sp.]
MHELIDQGLYQALAYIKNIDEVAGHASENTSRVPAIKTTQTMIFIVIRLFINLYSHVSNAAGNYSIRV